nr:alpha-galactosidase [Clostridia bacterium]
MAKLYRAYPLGDMCLSYYMDDEGHVGMMLVPGDVPAESPASVEPLVQWHLRGDAMTGGYSNGATMADTPSTYKLRFLAQEQVKDAIITTLQDEGGCLVYHRVRWHEGLEALRIQTEVVNRSGDDRILEMISSASIGGLSPYMEGDGAETLAFYRARSAWSAEGRLSRQTIEELHLERSWSGNGVRVEKYGQLGSMPVRSYFPFGALADEKNGVIWAMQLACPSSWQFELRRGRNGLCMTCGLADMDFGHWFKRLAPGEGLMLPEAYLTVGRGDIDAVSQRLQSIHKENLLQPAEALSVFFNEYCTTWGEPSHQNLARITRALQGHDIDYLIIDCGWYSKPGVPWYSSNGDWIPNEAEFFPDGLAATTKMIRDAGFKPGLWFEAETCAQHSDMYRRTDLLLHRNGTVIDTGGKRYLDLRMPEVRAYLDERVIGLLKSCNLAYIKIDYNDSIGVGCDGAESLGEGLRQIGQESMHFFRRLHEECPGLLVENCASGGHRLEPAMMSVSDMASFSDAHECPEIPIIAANLHRLILPCQEQIWAVLHGGDSLRRINYSIVNTLLGVMCLSGDIYNLSAEQWALVDRGIAFYREVGPIILCGKSAIHQHISPSWRTPRGWQAVVRRGDNGETLVVLHTFGGEFPSAVTLPVPAEKIISVLSSDTHQITLEDHQLTVDLTAPFDAVAIHLA